MLSHPGHPDRDDLVRRSNEEWNDYLRNVRPYLGWTIVVGHKTGEEA